ncbi:PqqD family protein [Nocardioides bigeumensis]|uniref:PqqD family protein n=1 Tax=Nocardioides bigeumensis TaxID=433657 RepID=A0ABP5K903_9ACTN
MTEVTFAVARDVAWVDAEAAGGTGAHVFLAKLPDGPPRVLSGPAWAIWMALAETAGSVDQIVTVTSELTGQDPEGIRSDIESFLARLLTEGLAVRSGRP